MRGFSDSIRIINNGGNVIFSQIDELNYLYASKACFIKNNGTAALIKAVVGPITVLSMDGSFTEIGNPAVAILDLAENSQALIYSLNGCIFTDNVISGPLTSTVILQHDGELNFPFPTQTLFSGTLINAPIGQDGGAGPTSFRPDTSGMFRPLATGCQYFDTDLGIPIFWTGIGWVDAQSNPV